MVKGTKKHSYTKIKKRNGKVVPFQKEKIAIAIGKAGKVTGEFEMDKARELLKQFGAARITELKESDYADFIEAASVAV